MISQRIYSFSLMHQMVHLVFNRPVSFLINVAVLAITICLPSFHFLLHSHYLHLVGEPVDQQQLTVFVRQQIEEQQLIELMDAITQLKNTQSVKLISRSEAAKEMKSIEEISIALEYLETNPFLDTIIIQPDHTLDQLELETLAKQLQRLPNVDDVYVDTNWSIAVSRLISTLQGILKLMSIAASIVVIVILFNFALFRVSADEEELKIKLMLGHYPWTIYLPYLFLGGSLSFFSGSISAAMSFLIYRFISQPIDAMMSVNIMVTMQNDSSLMMELFWIPFLSVLVGLMVTAFAVMHSYFKIRQTII